MKNRLLLAIAVFVPALAARNARRRFSNPAPPPKVLDNIPHRLADRHHEVGYSVSERQPGQYGNILPAEQVGHDFKQTLLVATGNETAQQTPRRWGPCSAWADGADAELARGLRPTPDFKAGMMR